MKAEPSKSSLWGGRTFEAIQHIIVFSSLVFNWLPEFQLGNMALHAMQVAIVILGASVEGIRIPQLICTACYFVHPTYYAIASSLYSEAVGPLAPLNMLIWLFTCLVFMHTVYYAATCGVQDFSRIATNQASSKAPFSVGIRHLKVTERQLETSVFYPIDHKDRGQDAYWFRDPERTTDAMIAVFGPLFGLPWIPRFVFRSYTTIKIPATEDAQIAAKFRNGAQKLRPVIFSHGLSSHKTFYTGVYHALASHGYLVICHNHQDESSFFTEDKDGKLISFVAKAAYDIQYRKQQVKIRIEEMLLVRKALKEMDKRLHKDIFGVSDPKVQVDMSELVFAGHSYGALTAVATSSQLSVLEQPKAVLMMDPWLFAIADDIKESRVQLKCPLLVINSTTFQGSISVEDFDTFGTMQKLISDCDSKLVRENVTVSNATHMGQTDYAVVAPWELSLLAGKRPQYQYGQAYQLHTWLMLAFLGANDQENYFDSKMAEQVVKDSEAEWLRWDLRTKKSN